MKAPLAFKLTFGAQHGALTSDETVLLMDNIEHFRKLMGWSRNRIYLMGAASMVAKDNPALVQQIVEYLSEVRSGPKVKL